MRGGPAAADGTASAGSITRLVRLRRLGKGARSVHSDGSPPSRGLAGRRPLAPIPARTGQSDGRIPARPRLSGAHRDVRGLASPRDRRRIAAPGRPGRLRGAILIVAGWLAAAPFSVWAIADRIGADPSRETFLGLAALIAGVGIVATLVSIRSAYVAVTPDSLELGRRPRKTVVEFAEIGSIVEGLPAGESLSMRIGRLEHTSGVVIHRVAAIRRDSLLIRLAGGRYLALYLSPVHFTNTGELRMSLLERNRGKIVGADSYTPAEIRRLKNAAINAIRML